MSSANRRIRQRQPLSVFRPLPFPNPFGPAYAIDAIPERTAREVEAGGGHNRRNSGWSCDTVCTWEQFATADPDDVLLKNTSEWEEEDERRGPFERFVDALDRALTTKLTQAEIGEYTTAYTDGYGTKVDPFMVKFLDGDKKNPLLHASRTKWLILITSGMATFAVAFGSSVFVGGVTGMQYSFSERSTVVTLLGLSFYVGGMGVGPMLFAPMSELLGRRPVFIATFVPFFLFQIGCALARNVQTMIVLRMLAGTIGSAPLTNSAGIVSDVFTVQERGIAMAVYALMPFLGPVFGPIVGGFVGSWDWHWLFWITAILAGVCLLGGSLIPETHAPVILRRRAKMLTAQTGKQYASMYDASSNGQLPSVKTYLTRPFALLFRELIVFLFAIYAALIYGVLYLMFGCYPVVFAQDRGFTNGEAGLPFIAVGIGMLFGMAGTIFCSIQYGAKLARNGGQPLAAEERLRGACVGAILLPVALAMFAATAKPSVHWIAPTISGGLFGCAMLLIFMGGTAYLVDSYLSVAASAMAANSLMRSVFAAVFPLFTLRMFEALGASWALGLLAFVCLGCAPIPYLFFVYGERIRRNSPYAAAQAQASAPKQQQSQKKLAKA